MGGGWLTVNIVFVSLVSIHGSIVMLLINSYIMQRVASGTIEKYSKLLKLLQRNSVFLTY